MSITASNNPLPNDPNDKYKEKLDRGSYQGTAQDLQNQINELTAPDEITKKGNVNVVGNVISIDALEFGWRLNTVEHTNVDDFSSTINPAGSGNKRVDIFVLTQYDAIVKIEGEVTTDFFVKRLAPEGTLECASVQIDGDTIGTPVISDANTASLLAHIERIDNPHQVTKEQVGLDQVDNTADIDKPVSTAQAAADASVLAAANAYTDEGLALKLNAADYNDRFKGKFLTEAAMRAAYPTANVGDEAQVNEVGSETVKNFSWDDELNDWVQSGSGGSGATNTDALPEGSSNLYFTTARAIAAVDVSGKEDSSNKTDDETTSITDTAKYFSVKGFWNAIKLKFFANLPAKETAIVDADTLALGDSEDGGKTKTRTWAQIKASLLDLFSIGKNFTFSAKGTYRAWQGIGVFDSNYIYVCSDRNSSFGLNNSIQKYDHKGNFISEVTSAYTQLDPGGKFMSFGSLISDDGTYYIIPAYNYNSGGSPLISRIARFNKTTLAYVDQFSIGGNVAEAAYLYGGEWYVCYFDIMKVRKFNTSWVQQAEYNLSPTLKPDGGYQSIFYKDGFWYMNWHGSNNYSGSYAAGLDKYTFNGTTFTFVETITAPTYGSGQGVTFFNNKYYWIDRPNNCVVITNKLGDILPQNISPTFKNIVVEDIINKLGVTSLTAINEFMLGTDYRVTLGPQGEFQLGRVAGTSTNSVLKLLGGTSSDTQIIHATSSGNKFLEGYDEAPIPGFRLYHYGFSKPVLFAPYANDYIGLNGITDPKSKLEIGGGIKIANDSDAASVDKVGTMRYRTSGNNSYIDICMQTGASTYAWVNISTQSW